MKIRSSYLIALSLFSPFATVFADQADIVTPANERVLLTENFDQNYNAWSHVAVVNAVGTAMTGEAEISNGVWKPSVEADNNGVTSMIDTTFDLSAGDISVYFKAAVGGHRTEAGGRFGIRLNENDAHKRFVFHVYPGTNGIVQYKSNGATTDLKLASSRNVVSSGSFVTYKLVISAPNGVGAPGSIEAFYYDEQSASYVSFGQVTGSVDLGDAVLDSLMVFSRNGLNADTAARISQLIVTQSNVQ
jgi:hypothetical protein